MSIAIQHSATTHFAVALISLRPPKALPPTDMISPSHFLHNREPQSQTGLSKRLAFPMQEILSESGR